MERLTARWANGSVIPTYVGYDWLKVVVGRLADFEDLIFDEDGDQIVSLEELEKIIKKMQKSC